MEGLKEIRKDAFLKGLVLGALLLIIDIASLYLLANSQSLMIILLSYLMAYFIIPLTVAIILIKKLREKIGGYWTLRQATSGIFIMFLTGYLFSSAGSFVFIKYVQPQIPEMAKNNFVNVFSNFMSRVDADQDKIDETVENIEQQFEAMGQATVGSFFGNMVTSIIILFITALILAAIFKRENPVPDQV
jgi:NADH:ubiquinone oxidoreductase subunit 6 (subunit J)